MTINGLIVPDHINYMSIHAAASVLAPGLTPGRLSRISLAPTANPQRVCWWPGAEPGMRLNCIAYTGLCSPKPCGVTVIPSSTPSFAHTASHSPTRLQTAPSVLTTDILSGSCTACRTSKHTVCMRVYPSLFLSVNQAAFTSPFFAPCLTSAA